MKQVPLLFFFALALVFVLFGSILFPLFPLTAFAPFLAIVYYVAPFPKALWISVGCGLIIDFLSSEFHFGISALSYAITSAILFHQKRHFFEDKSMAFFLFTSLISSALTLVQIIFIHLFDRGISFSLITFLTDLIVLPFVDGLYGFLWFICPMKLYIYIKKTGWKALFKKPAADEQ